MISTRGVKFKFSTGEKVLCYEPDPTKAKVLYESKVLDLVANRDGRGRKVCEYLIHFHGWNSSWDRYVREEFILPYTEENRKLQIKLAEEAALSLKGKKKHKLPPLIKETLSKKLCANNESKENKKLKTPPPSDSESSEEEIEREITIELPNSLKRVLEEDRMLITEKNKFVKLPCENNVIDVLESYVKHHAVNLLCASPPKNGQKLMPEEVKNRLNLCKEAMDGLRILFDFTLPHLLLYRQEKKQFYTVGTTCSPLSSTKSEQTVDEFQVKIESSEPVSHGETTKIENNIIELSKTEAETPVQNRTPKCRPNLRNQCNKLNQIDMEVTVNIEPADKSNDLKPLTQKKELPKNKKSKSKNTSTRVLRSRDKVKQPAASEPSANDSTAPAESSRSCAVSESPVEPTCPSRITRKSGLNPFNLLNQPHSSLSICDRSTPNSPTSGILNIESILPPTVASNCFSSSNSSTHSTISKTLLENQQHNFIHYSNLLQEVMSWHLLPHNLYEQIPAAPSLIYGAHHLLRLFVKLPALISKMSMKQRKLDVLLEIIENFLLYISDKKDELFSYTAYMDSSDIFPVGTLGILK